MIRPQSIDFPSPNFRPCPPGREVSCVVLHATAGARDGALATLCDPRPDSLASRVSAHYLIDEAGAVYRLVDERDVAWHAGVSAFDGNDGVNAFSIGIELVNPNDGKTPYPQPQVAACLELVADICLEHGIRAAAVVGHKDVAPGRKTDPAGFDFDGFRTALVARGIDA